MSTSREKSGSALRSFLAAELLKLRHWRIAKVSLAAICFTPPLLIGVMGSLKADVSVFPEVLQMIGASLWVLIGVATLMLTADWVGNEFEWGTARMVLGRGVPRGVFVVGKGMVLLGVVVVNALAGWFCSGVAAVTSHVMLAGTPGLGEGVGALLTSGLAGVGILVLEGAAYIGIGLFIGVLTRSPALTSLGGLGFLMGDFLLGEFALIPEVEGGLGAFSILSNTSSLLASLPVTMISVWAASDVAGPKPGIAIFALACYAIVGMVSSCCLFQRLDFTGR